MKVRLFAFVLLISIQSSFAKVLFTESYDVDNFSNTQNAQRIDGSLDYKFRKEYGGRLRITDNEAGLAYKLSGEVHTKALESANQELFLSINMRCLTQSNTEKYAGIIFYNDNGDEVFGIGNDWQSEYFSFWQQGDQPRTIGDVPVLIDNDVHMVVMRVIFDSDGPEHVTLWLDPIPNWPQNKQYKHISTKYECELHFSEIRIRSGKKNNIWEFDEIIFGTTWKDVNPVNTSNGENVKNILSNTNSFGIKESVGDGIVRFWPKGCDTTNIPPSFVSEKPLTAGGIVSSNDDIIPRFGVVNGKKTAYIGLSPDIDLYGTGEVTGSLLRNNYKISLFNTDCYGYKIPGQLYQSHPWVLGLRPDGTAFGVIFDCTWKAELNLRNGILFTTGKDANDFPVIVIEGDSPQQVLTRLAGITGTMPMPPKWALGFQQCRYSYYPDARVREVVDTFRSKRIPCDVLWFDIDYMDGFRIFTFDNNHFPDPVATNDYLHNLGFKSVWMIDPGVKYDEDYFVYQSGTAKDLWVKAADGKSFIGPVWPGDCVFPDFTMPETRKWWAGLYKDFMARGIDGVWNDMNEPSVFDAKLDGTMPLDNIHRGGDDLPSGSHKQYHNVYGMLMVKASRDGILKANPDKRPFILSRSNFLGGHRYAATWTGDNKATWEHMQMSIPMTLNMGLSGQPFNGPDIGGFIGDATPELWGNWISIGAFFPFSRAHTAIETKNQEPWAFGSKTEDASRVALERRYRLMPYIYTLFRQSHINGLPVMRPAFFADPADIRLREEDQAFMLGDGLMVIPAWAENPALPNGIWHPLKLTETTGLSDDYQSNLMIKGGSIIPVGRVVQSTSELNDKEKITLVIALDSNGKARGKLYEDDGDGYSFKNGDYCLSEFSAELIDGRVIVKLSNMDGNNKYKNRLVSVAVIDENGVSSGYGDIANGVKVIIDPQNIAIPQ